MSIIYYNPKREDWSMADHFLERNALRLQLEDIHTSNELFVHVVRCLVVEGKLNYTELELRYILDAENVEFLSFDCFGNILPRWDNAFLSESIDIHRRILTAQVNLRELQQDYRKLIETGLPTEIIAGIKQRYFVEGNKIQAIKYLRQQVPAFDIKAAKDFVDAMLDKEEGYARNS